MLLLSLLLSSVDDVFVTFSNLNFNQLPPTSAIFWTPPQLNLARAIAIITTSNIVNKLVSSLHFLLNFKNKTNLGKTSSVKMSMSKASNNNMLQGNIIISRTKRLLNSIKNTSSNSGSTQDSLLDIGLVLVNTTTQQNDEQLSLKLCAQLKLFRFSGLSLFCYCSCYYRKSVSTYCFR